MKRNEKLRPKLVVWVRVWGKNFTDKAILYINNLYSQLNISYVPYFILCTNHKDPIAFRKSEIQNLGKIVYANMHSYSEAINKLLEYTPDSLAVLHISLGIKINIDNLQQAFCWLSKECYAYGWEIENYLNDGSDFGKLWYNTAVLLNSEFISLLKKNPLPNWIDNGYEGVIKTKFKEIPIGGLEELYMMQVALQASEDNYFVLDCRAPLCSSENIATDIDYYDKVERKQLVANYYLENKLAISKDDLLDSFIILNKNKIIIPDKFKDKFSNLNNIIYKNKVEKDIILHF